jgi:hypothetical protein
MIHNDFIEHGLDCVVNEILGLNGALIAKINSVYGVGLNFGVGKEHDVLSKYNVIDTTRC